MPVDLKKIRAEMAEAESKLAAIDRDIDECRVRYFEHPWVWSEKRRTLTFERHRVQRRLEELMFVRDCVGGRLLGSAAMLSLLSCPGLGKRSTLEHQPTLQVIQGGRIW